MATPRPITRSIGAGSLVEGRRPREVKGFAAKFGHLDSSDESLGRISRFHAMIEAEVSKSRLSVGMSRKIEIKEPAASKYLAEDEDMLPAFHHPYADTDAKTSAFVKRHLMEVFPELPPRLIPRSYEREISHEGLPSYLVVGKIPGMGDGVFTKKMIPKGSFIGIYAGECFVDRGKKYGAYKPHYEFEVYQDPSSGASLVVDAERKGNFTRWFNHGGELANVEASGYVDKAGRIYIVMTAKEDIETGRQLLLDYGSEYWEDLGLKPFPVRDNTYVYDMKSHCIVVNI